MEITIHEEKISHFTFHGKKKGRSRVTKIPCTSLFQTGRFAVSRVCGRIIRNLESKNKLKIHCHCFDSRMTKTHTRHFASAVILFYCMYHTIYEGLSRCNIRIYELGILIGRKTWLLTPPCLPHQTMPITCLSLVTKLAMT